MKRRPISVQNKSTPQPCCAVHQNTCAALCRKGKSFCASEKWAHFEPEQVRDFLFERKYRASSPFCAPSLRQSFISIQYNTFRLEMQAEEKEAERSIRPVRSKRFFRFLFLEKGTNPRPPRLQTAAKCGNITFSHTNTRNAATERVGTDRTFQREASPAERALRDVWAEVRSRAARASGREALPRSAGRRAPLRRLRAAPASALGGNRVVPRSIVQGFVPEPGQKAGRGRGLFSCPPNTTL